LHTVDVFIPCYNYGRYLRRCVDSVLQQAGCNTRVLIIDDCSTDGSLADARAIAASDPRVEVMAHPVNRGHIATYNEGIDWVRAPVMLLLSADDLLAPGALGRAADLFAANPSITLVHGRSVRFGDEAELATAEAGLADGALPVRIQTGAQFIRTLCEVPVNTVETATAIVRSAAQKRVGGYRPELPHAGDLEMWLRLAAEGDVAFVDGVQAFTRVHGNNMHHQFTGEKLIGDYRQRHEAYRSFFASQGGTLPDQAALERLVEQRLGEEVYWAAMNTFDAGNAAGARPLADLARRIDPLITTTPAWMKLRMKMMLGVGPARRLARIADMLRGSAVTSHGSP
jgi:glycosyltransferase involved in cell wall biosynthesis